MAISKAELLSVLSRYRNKDVAYMDGRFVQKVTGKDLSANDFTDVLKSKLEGIAAGAQVNVIESIDIDGDHQTITGKNVTLELKNYATKKDLEAYAKSADLTTVFTYKGTVANYTDLPKEGNKVGYVYNITNAGGTDSKGVPIKAGDNVVYCESTERLGGWDVLAGTTDLSDYVTNDALTTRLGDYVTASGLTSQLTTTLNSYYTKSAADNAFVTKTSADNKYVAKETGKGLSANDFTNEWLERLKALHENANEVVTDAEIVAIFS